eukprot:TCONS_00028552-protein
MEVLKNDFGGLVSLEFGIPRMLLFSLVIILLSPFTALNTNALSIPTISSFNYYVDDLPNNRKRIHLECITNSNPRPKITFYKDGIELKDDPRINRAADDQMYIHNVTYLQDDGVYKCSVANHHGESYEEKEIKIYVVGNFVAGSRKDDPADLLDVIVGLGTRIHCPDHSHSYPVRYLWRMKGKFGVDRIIQEDRSFMYLNDGKVLFLSLVTKDIVDRVNKAGGVSCLMSINSNLVESRKIKLKIVDEQTDFDSKPFIHEELPAKQHVLEGKPVTLKCAASGSPLPQVKWYRNGIEININDSSLYRVNARLPEKFTILKMTDKLEGKYKCQFTNRAGMKASTGDVIVARAPKISDSSSTTIKRYLKEELKLYCNASGSGNLMFTWVRNGSQLATFQSNERSIEINKGVLTITNVSYDEQGVYQCFVKSQYGRDSQVFNVLISQRTGSSIGDKNDSNIHNNNSNNNSSDSSTSSSDSPLELKYIILIGSGGGILVILLCGGIFMYVRTKKDKEQEQFIPIPSPGYSDYTNSNNSTTRSEGPIYAKPSVHEPMLGHPASSEMGSMNDSIRGAKMDDPEFLRLMSTLRRDQHNNENPPFEHFYQDINNSNDGNQSTTPSTVL